MPYYERIKNSHTEVVPCNKDDHITAINALCLYIWVSIVNLCIQNEYIVNWINFRKQIEGIFDCIEEYGLSNSDYVNKTIDAEFHAVSKTKIDDMVQNISYLFNSMMNSIQHQSDHSNIQDLIVNDKGYEDMKNEMDDQTIKSNNEDQQPTSSSKILLTVNPVINIE